MSDLEGTRIGPYRILSPLGEGGMGQVYLAEDSRLRRKVAIKILPPATANDDEARGRLLREARAAATLDHPNICPIFEVGEEGARTFIVMQYLEGETVKTRLVRRPFAFNDAIDAAIQIADALSEAHRRGVVHRDIKPENIMLTASGRLKVLDFGLAKVSAAEADIDAATASLFTTPGVVMGTVPYMSPEQVRGESVGPPSDIFSFGSLLWELLGGHRPFQGKTNADLVAAILTSEPPPINLGTPAGTRAEKLARRCLEKEPSRRPRSMDEIRVELEQIRAESSGPQAITAPATPAHRARWPLFAAVAGLLVLIAVAVAYRFTPTPAAPAAAIPSKRVNSAAFDLYLRGKVHAANHDRASLERAIELLRKAVEADSSFATAWAELARAYTNFTFNHATAAEREPMEEDAAFAVAKALSLDPNLAEAHLAEGVLLWTHTNRFPHDRAIQAYRHAIELNPSLDEAHHQLALVYFHLGLFDVAWKALERAVQLNPSNTLARLRFGVIDMYRGQWEEALAVFKSTPIKKSPAIWAFQTGTALFRLGRTAEAKELIEGYIRDNNRDEGGVGTSVLAMILAKEGKRAEAEKAIAHAIEVGEGFGHFHHTAYNIASAYALMGDTPKAVKWLQTAADDGFPNYPLFATDAQLASLRSDPQFVALLADLEQKWRQYAKAYGEPIP